MPKATVRLLAVAAWIVLSPVAASAQRDGDAIAIVNGRPLSKDALVRLLMDAHGVSALQQLVLLELAQQETKARGLKVTDADVEREAQQALAELAEKAGLGPDATQANKEQALKTMLDEKNISMAEYNLAMRRNAHLRKLVEADLDITEATLRAEFARRYGERRVVRHVQIRVGEAKLLNQAVSDIRNGLDFADVARRLSQNPESAPKGGELPPFAFDDAEIPPAMREQAFAMRVGEVSNPLRTEQAFHILKLERIIPPESERFEDVRAELERTMRARVSQQKMGERMTELFNRVTVNVLDSKLKREYEAFVKEARAKGDTP